MPTVEDHYPEDHIRVLRIALDGRILYSIDHYQKLDSAPSDCMDGPMLDGYRLCYKSLGRCTAVIVVTPAGAELVNLRLEASPGEDPGPVEARRLCLKEAKRAHEAVRAPKRG